jgi:hypothetical protein
VRKVPYARGEYGGAQCECSAQSLICRCPVLCHIGLEDWASCTHCAGRAHVQQVIARAAWALPFRNSAFELCLDVWWNDGSAQMKTSEF